MMDRRQFLKMMLLTPLISLFPDVLFALARQVHWQNLLILVELKGGNDGLNTLIPYKDRLYYEMRPKLSIARDKIIKFESDVGFHPALSKMVDIWKDEELAIIQGVGYPDPNLSHFRSIEIWETGSGANQVISDGWLSRLFADNPPPEEFTADGVVIGAQSLGPLNGLNSRTLVVPQNNRRMRKAMKEDRYHPTRPNPSLMHIMKVQEDYKIASEKMFGAKDLRTSFPDNRFGNALKRASQIVESDNKVAVIKVSVGGFDTHAGQIVTHNRILKQLGDGLAALRLALKELNRWDSTVVMTYSEFGRRPSENLSKGTDHGTSNVQFMMGGKVKGGLYGKPFDLSDLQGGNMLHGIDFRSMYSTIIDDWWGMDSYDVFGKRFSKLNVLKT